MADGGTKRLRGKSWQFRAYVHGRYITKTVPPESGRAVGEKRADQMLRRWVSAEEAKGATVPAGTVAELWAKWWRHASPNWKDDGDAWDSYWRKHIRPAPVERLGGRALGDVLVVDVRTEDIDELYTTLRSKLAAGSILKVHTALNMCFAQAVRWGHIARSPVDDATRPKVPKKAIRVPSNDQVNRLIALAEKTNPDLMCYLHVATDTGARRSMVVGLRWDSVDLKRGEVVFQTSAVVKRGKVISEVDGVVKRAKASIVIRETTKADNEWRVSLHDSTADRLKAHLLRARDRAETIGVEWSDQMFVFTSDPAGILPWVPSSPTHAFGRLRQRAGTPGVRLHDLRHFMATTYLAMGVSVPNVMGRGGWQDMRSFERYTHFLPTVDKAAAKKVGDHVFGKAKPPPRKRRATGAAGPSGPRTPRATGRRSP